jgi:ribosomal protein S18 acetylase RimI-like enzyme
MYIPDSYPHIGIEIIPSNLDEAALYRASLEVSCFMRDTVHTYYTDELGLKYIDPDPASATPEEIAWRMGRIRSAEVENREYMIARYLYGEPAMSPTAALAGLLVTQRVTEHEDDVAEDFIDIIEWDVAKEERGNAVRRGLGGIMLRRKFRFVDEDMGVTLDVAEANAHARAIYEHYGFQQYAEPVEYGVFDTKHIPLATEAGILKHKLGLI